MNMHFLDGQESEQRHENLFLVWFFAFYFKMLVNAMGYFQPGVGIVVENADSFMCYTWPFSLHCMIF